ncbi:MAG: 30S ribosomal protein S13 [bacterium]|nr:30S ribosomal protein S13 [bacterium]
MPRIVGVDIPPQKRVEIALTYIYGVGRVLSNKILSEAGIDPNTRAKDLTPEDVSKISTVIQSGYKVEGDLRRDVTGNIKRLVSIHCYRGLRHRAGLPVRGQKTRRNARTRKGPRRATVALKKKLAK